MMTVTSKDLERLLAPSAPPCVSIYVSAPGRRRLTAADRVRMRIQFADVYDRLARHYHRRDVDQLLVPVVCAVERAWPPPARSVAIFRSPDECVTCTLPVEVPDLVVVSDSFHTAPLGAFLERTQRFFVLALSEKATRLYTGTPERLDEVIDPAIPSSVEETFGARSERQRYFGVHGGGAGGVHRRGLAEAGRARKERLRRFFRVVDRGVSSYLRGSSAPLVLAGVRSVQALYRSASRYPRILEHGVEGAVNALSTSELHARAWAVIEDWDRERRAIEARRARGARIDLPGGRDEQPYPAAVT